MRNNIDKETADKPAAQPTTPEVSHNLYGQRLGRKGQETRERILATALSLIEAPQDAPITLSGVAREASVGMTTLYLYFPDLGDLVLAVLTRLMGSAGAAFEDQLKTRWPDASLSACSSAFLRSHYEFWARHARILQMRNSYADAGDARFLNYRSRATLPQVEALVLQMDGTPNQPNSPCTGIATVLLIGLERLATILTNPTFYSVIRHDGVTDEAAFIDLLLTAEAAVMTLAMQQQRYANRREGDATSQAENVAGGPGKD